MFNTKIRTTIITLIAACSFATATVAPAVSQADPVEGDGATKRMLEDRRCRHA